MPKPARRRRALSSATTVAKIRDAKWAGRKLVRVRQRADFIRRVETAVEIYGQIQEPSALANEIARLRRALDRARGRARAATLYRALSAGTREFLAEFGISPPQANDPESAEVLRSRLVTSGIWRKDKGQRRWVETLLAKQKQGRPGSGREEVLVANLAFALVAAGISVERSWGGNGATPFERLIEEVLIALAIDDKHSAAMLARRHIEARERQ